MLIFVHIEKTGGRTVRYIQRSSYGLRHCEVEPDGLWEAPPFSTTDLRRIRRLYPNLASLAAHRVTAFVDLEEPGTHFRYFTLLRDPLKMGASRYQFHLARKKNKLPFAEWIQKEAVQNAQTKQIAGVASAADAIRVIERKSVFVGLTEHFDESLVLLKSLLAPDLDIGYESVNVARGNTLAKDLLATPSTRQALIEVNGADLELYEYARTELYPALQREYGPSLTEAVADYQQHSRRTFNRTKLTLSRVKQYGVYKPTLRLYRGNTSGMRATS